MKTLKKSPTHIASTIEAYACSCGNYCACGIIDCTCSSSATPYANTYSALLSQTRQKDRNADNTASYRK